ncbi:alpha/beta fold hydrolase [Ureibacillus sp. FSL K6-8385]|uniref:Alpha/beta fold hydrolase n=1 Tax=Ureibacillus terrenus TaxID=118246 RepID=A0A540V119_9BACL|nr:alpha/beta fold hydrolase [Ureibacillus terrenus]MED3662267.1 alpha/beta fold hydrolase [Ureibacillus terrenus]MED3764040.1 alpha/beta fold hydrolase [Ureibacillus terrenus]TQE90421.1 alpha/beta fold hydrolase [Ureibacillus terrenus]
MSIGVLMLHGFSGGPNEIKPLADYIQKHTDWFVETPTLCGHGDQLSLNGFTAEHWLIDAELAYKRLAQKAEQIFVVGFSMGGVIALYLAKRYPVKKLVLLSAAVKYIAPKQLLKDLRKIAKEAVGGQLKNNEFFRMYEYKLRNVPVSAAIQFMRIVRQVEPYIESIDIPTFIVQGKCDGVVPYSTAQYLYDKLPATEKYLYYSSCGKHHICFSEDCESWFADVLRFLQS